MSKQQPGELEEYTDERSVSGRVFDYVVTSLDWPSSALALLNAVAGMVSVYGTVDEINALKKRGLGVHAPYCDYTTGMYIWQMTRADYQKAQKAGLA